MDKIKVLFVCIHNSARSQMAEAFLKQIGNDKLAVESAGIEPGKLNPIVVEAMHEIGIDISGNKTKSVFDFYKQGKKYHYVITVCGAAKSEQCPIFPGTIQQLHWSFTDPASFSGTNQEILAKTRIIREQIRTKVAEFAQASDRR